MSHSLTLTILPGAYAVCRLDAGKPVPAWAWSGAVCSVTRTPDELSIICSADAVPADVRREGDWRCLQLRGPFPFTMTGVLRAVLAPLAEAGIGILALSTYDTDYVWVKEQLLEQALASLREAGHQILPSED